MDISKITLPSGNTYNIKDEVARQAMTGGMHFIGVSTTAVTDDGDEVPTIDGVRVIPKNGDVVVYNKKEFVYSGTETPGTPQIHINSGTVAAQGGQNKYTYNAETGVLTSSIASVGMSLSFDVTYTSNTITLTYKSSAGLGSGTKTLHWVQDGVSDSVTLTTNTSFTKTFSDADTKFVTSLYLTGAYLTITNFMGINETSGHWAEFGDLSDLGDLAYIDKNGDTTKYLNGNGGWTVPPKNTAGSTDTSSKIFLIGATSQAASPQTYSHDTAYVGTDGCLYSGGTKVLTAHQTIKQDGVTGATVNRYASCSTAAGAAAKTASITTGTFSLEAGSIVNVKFANTNTANTPTLNINGTGAKNIFSNGAQISTGTNKGLLKGLCTFIYDGTQYHLVGGYIDTQYSLPIADYDTLGGVKPFISRTSDVIGPTPATASGTVIVRSNTDAPGNYFPIETDAYGHMFVNAPVPQVFSVDQAQNQTALESGIQDAAYTNGIVNYNGGLAATAFFGKVNVSVDITISSVVIKLGNYNCFIETIPFGTVDTGYLLGSLTMSKVPNTIGVTIDDLEIYHAVFTISMADPFRAPEFKWIRTGALAWKSSVSASYTPAGSVTVTTNATTNKTTTVSTTSGTATYTPGGTVGTPTISVKTAGTTTTVKNPTSVAVAKTVATAAPGATAPANAVTTCDVSNETLRLYQVGYTTGDSITTSNVTVKTGDAEYQSSQPSWTGTGVRLVTGNIAVPNTYTASFSGTAATITSS